MRAVCICGISGARAEFFHEHQHVARLEVGIVSVERRTRRTFKQTAFALAPGIEIDAFVILIKQGVFHRLEYQRTICQGITQLVAGRGDALGRVRHAREQRCAVRNIYTVVVDE